jgi:hypothetical protein
MKQKNESKKKKKKKKIPLVTLQVCHVTKLVTGHTCNVTNGSFFFFSWTLVIVVINNTLLVNYILSIYNSN